MKWTVEGISVAVTFSHFNLSWNSQAKNSITRVRPMLCSKKQDPPQCISPLCQARVARWFDSKIRKGPDASYKNRPILSPTLFPDHMSILSVPGHLSDLVKPRFCSNKCPQGLMRVFFIFVFELQLLTHNSLMNNHKCKVGVTSQLLWGFLIN